MEDCRLVYNFVLLCPAPRAEMAEMEILMKEKHPQDERDAFNRLYLDYQPRFVRFANSYIRDLPVAEDIVTESLLYYWENRNALVAESNVPAYVLSVIRSKCLNYLRHLEVREDYSQAMRDYYEWDLNARLASLEACEPYELFSAEIHELVDAAFHRMPEKTRRIFRMHRVAGKSYREIAEATGLSVKGVDFHIQKALKLLRKELKDYFPLFLIFC